MTTRIIFKTFKSKNNLFSEYYRNILHNISTSSFNKSILKSYKHNNIQLPMSYTMHYSFYTPLTYIC